MSNAATARQLLVLTGAQIEALLDLEVVVACQDEAFRALASGTGQLAPRLLLPSGNDISFCYASRLSADTGAVCKFGSVNPGNRELDLPTVSALVVVQDPVTGRPLALLDGEAVTVARTAAASVLAVRTLAAPGDHVLALLGSGAQGRAHARAFVRSVGVSAIRVWSPFPDERRIVAAKLSEELAVSVVAANSPAVALLGADLVVTATTSTEPVLDRDMLKPGATVISVGSFAHDRREVGDDVVVAARVVVDDVNTALQQAGPVLHAIASGVLQPGSLVGLGQVLLGEPGRRSHDELVFYNSVGVGIQDAAAAWLAVGAANERGIGQLVDL